MDKRLTTCGMIISGILLVSCKSVDSVPRYTVVDTYCDIAKPILLLRSEVNALSRETKQQIYAHNETWKKKCNDDKMPSRKG